MPPWRWVVATAVSFFSVFAVAIFYARGPAGVVMLGLCLGFSACFMISSAISQSLLLAIGLGMRLYATVLGCKHDSLPFSLHEGDAGENGVLRGASLLARPQQGGSGTVAASPHHRPVLNIVPHQTRITDAESIASSSLAAYRFVQRGVFDGFGLRVLSYIVLGMCLAIHTLLQTAIGLLDVITGLPSGWAFWSFPAIMQHSAVTRCLRSVVKSDHSE